MNMLLWAGLAALGRGCTTSLISTSGLTEAQMLWPARRIAYHIIQDYSPADLAALKAAVNSMTDAGFNSYVSLALQGTGISNTFNGSSEYRPRAAYLAVLGSSWFEPSSGSGGGGGISAAELQTVLDRYLWDSDASAPKTILPTDIPVMEITRNFSDADW